MFVKMQVHRRLETAVQSKNKPSKTFRVVVEVEEKNITNQTKLATHDLIFRIEQKNDNVEKFKKEKKNLRFRQSYNRRSVDESMENQSYSQPSFVHRDNIRVIRVRSPIHRQTSSLSCFLNYLIHAIFKKTRKNGVDPAFPIMTKDYSADCHKKTNIGNETCMLLIRKKNLLQTIHRKKHRRISHWMNDV